MERIPTTKPSGIRTNALHAWGMLFTAFGIVGQSILQNRLLGIGQISAQALLEAMQESDGTMLIATLALVLHALETCAVPIFAFLLVEGYQHTSSFRKYILRVLGVAVVSEVPYNLAMGGRLLDFSSRNPVFGLVLGLIVLYLYDRYGEKTAKYTIGKVVITIAALLWPLMLGIEYGSCVVLTVAVLWAFRKKPLMRNFAGATVSIVCSLYSPFFLAAPMGFLAVHLYNGEKGAENRLANYLAYPLLLLVIGLAGILAL
ncbi:MAG: TraX family protein [Faecousia sp.]